MQHNLLDVSRWWGKIQMPPASHRSHEEPTHNSDPPQASTAARREKIVRHQQVVPSIIIESIKIKKRDGMRGPGKRDREVRGLGTMGAAVLGRMDKGGTWWWWWWKAGLSLIRVSL